jgi:hypothetical protein
MATAQSFVLKPLEQADESRVQRVNNILGLLNGLAIGLAVAIGAWGPEIFALSGLPIPLRLEPIVLGIALVVGVCTLAGWLSARINRTWSTLLVWLAAAVLVALIIGHASTVGRTLVTWLLDSRFAERTPLAPQEGSAWLSIITSFWIILVFVILAFLQANRLEGMRHSLSGRQVVSRGAMFRLILPLPLVALAGWAASDFSGGNAIWRALHLFDRAIEVAGTYEGDLFALSRQEGINYNALRAVRDELDGPYTILLGENDPVNSTVRVVAHFDNGLWLNCQVILNQLTNCSDASRPYSIGLTSLVTGVPVAEDCVGCMPREAEEWTGWFEERRSELGADPVITFQAQHGDQVLMQIESADGDYAVECWFTGIIPVTIDSCQEAVMVQSSP